MLLDKQITYEIIEEVICLKILTPFADIAAIEAKSWSIYTNLKHLEEKTISDFDIISLAGRLSCYNTIEQMWKYAKYKDVTL